MPRTRDELREAFWNMVGKTGRVYVAQDVYEALLDDPSIERADPGEGWPLRYGAIDILVSRHLSPGAMIASDPGGFTSRDSRG